MTPTLKPPPPSVRTVHAGDVAVTVTSGAAEASTLADYFNDYLPGPPCELRLPSFQMNLRTGASPFRAAVYQFNDLPGQPIEPIPGVVLWEASTATGRRCYTVARDAVENTPGAWAAAIEDRHIDLYCPDPAPAPRYALRLIRETMLRSYENAAGVVFHAAGVDIGGDAVMICGNGGAGKTTTMTALLRHLADDAAMLSNDRLIFHGADRLVPVPLPVQAARGTITAYAELTRAAADLARARAQQTNIEDLPTEFATPTKLAFPARGYADAFGASLSAGARLSAVILAAFTDTVEPIQVRRLDRERARNILAASCFTPHDEFWRPWLVSRTQPDHILAEAADRVCAHIATTATCVEVRFGVRGEIRRLEQTLADLIGDLR